MNDFAKSLIALKEKRNVAEIIIRTLGAFEVYRRGEMVSDKEFGRDIAVQLLQFFITFRHRRAMHKEQIIDRLWPELDQRSGEQNFKAALHGLNKVLEPDREKRAQAAYIIRHGATYRLNNTTVWIDIEAIDSFIQMGNKAVIEYHDQAVEAYYEAIQLYDGIYLPNRLFDDWASEERERIQLMVLGAMIDLSALLVKTNPMESVRITHEALQIDPTWEDAYRIQMMAYFEKGNRPMAIKSYHACKEILEKEFGIEPLPETTRLFKSITAA